MNKNMELEFRNYQVNTCRGRTKLFMKIYWPTLIMILSALFFITCAMAIKREDYKCFCVFLLFATFLLTDVMPACVSCFLPITVAAFIGVFDPYFPVKLIIRSTIIDVLGVMMLIVAIERCKINRRFALKILLLLGYSHFKLSFLLFFATMFLAMWLSAALACGIMIPLVKAILVEIAEIGVIDFFHEVDNTLREPDDEILEYPRPTDITIFYFLGIAYSSNIGGMATLMGSETNQLFQLYARMLFPSGPTLEFPQFMLLSLPGVLLLQSLFYLWMNLFFLRMIRQEDSGPLQTLMTDEEIQYMKALLAAQYRDLEPICFQEIVVVAVVLMAGVLQLISSLAYDKNPSLEDWNIKITYPSIICAFVLFVIPSRTDFINFFKIFKDTDSITFPKKPSPGCLNWFEIRDGVNWSVLLVLGGSTLMFEMLKESNISREFEKLLGHFSSWPAPILVLVVILYSKVFTEFAPNPSVILIILPSVARFSVAASVHPHYLMSAATLAISLPFHLRTGGASNAMAAAYIHIPSHKMMYAGIGPSIISILVIWFTVVVWSKAIWNDLNIYPRWAYNHTL